MPTSAPLSNPSQPLAYEICVQGQLGPNWQDWFGEVRILLAEDGTTLFLSPPADQAALYGLLKKVRDLNLTLISVIPADPSGLQRPSPKLKGIFK